MRQTRVGWGKQAIFELNASISRKRSKLLLMTNRKFHIDTTNRWPWNFQRISLDFADLGGNNS